MTETEENRIECPCGIHVAPDEKYCELCRDGTTGGSDGGSE